MVNKWIFVLAAPVAALALGYIHKALRKRANRQVKKNEEAAQDTEKEHGVDIGKKFKDYLNATKGNDLELNFAESAKMLRYLTRLSDDDKLCLYGLFKQANEGDCNKSKPVLNYVDVKKWEAWKKNAGTSKPDAKQKYFQIIREAVNKYQDVRDDDLDAEEPAQEQRGPSQGLGIKVSRPGQNLGMETAEKTEIMMSEESTEFFKSIDQGKIETLRAYIAKGYDLKQLNKAGVNPLHHAVDKENIEVVKLLLAHSADPNIADKEGLTALHYAVLVENREIIELLIAKNCNYNAKDNQGKSPLDEAEKDLREFMENTIKKYRS